MATIDSPAGSRIDLAAGRPALVSSTCVYSRWRDRESEGGEATHEIIPRDYAFHTDNEQDPWWAVDLQQGCLVEEICITNRSDGSERFRTFSIESSFNGRDWISRYTKSTADAVSSDLEKPWSIELSPPIVARFVRVTLLGHCPLHLRRVQIFGQVVSMANDETNADISLARMEDLSPGKELVREYYQLGLHKISLLHRGSAWDCARLDDIFKRQMFQVPGAFHGFAFTYHQSILGSGMVPLVVDSGAKDGASSLFFSYTWQPCEVHALETAACQIEVLKENLQGRSAAIHRARLDWQDGYSVERRRFAGLGSSDVRLMTIDRLMSGPRLEPFILKIGQGGAEETLFSGIPDHAARFPIVMIESRGWRTAGESRSLAFMRWHAARGREFAFSDNMVFSIDTDRLTNGPAARPGAAA